MITGKSNKNTMKNIEEKSFKELADDLKYIRKIELRGLPSQQIPPASYIASLFNYINLLDKTDTDTKLELEYILAISLINARKFIQACEILRRIEGCISANDKIQNRYSKAAKLEILIAESMNQYFQLDEKLKALKRAIDLSLGRKIPISNLSPPTKYANEDVFSFLVKYHKELIKLILSLLTDKSEFIKVAAVKSLDFLMENMGCSLGPYVIIILKGILNTFPGNPKIIFNESSTASLNPHAHLNEIVCAISSIPTKLPSHYNHLLETYGTVLNSVSSQYLHNIFYDIILPITYERDIITELRSILLSISDRILSICQGDLIPTPIFLNGILNDMNAGNKKLAGNAQNLWQCIKSKLFPNCEKVGRIKLCQWVIESLVDIGNKMRSHVGNRDTAEEDALLKLDLYIEVAFIFLSDKPSEEAPNPLVITTIEDKSDYYELLSPLLYWMNFAISSEDRQDLFVKIWNCVILLLKDMKETMNMNPNIIIAPILKAIKDYCKNNSPSISMLKVILRIIQDCKCINDDKEVIIDELVVELEGKMQNNLYEDIFDTVDVLYEIVPDYLD